MSGHPEFATFLRGFTLLLPFQLCVVGSSFAMRRFGYGDEAVSIFVPLTMNAMEILLTMAGLCAAAQTALIKAVAAKIFTFVSSGISMVSTTFSVVVSALLLRTYALDDDVDNITRYYWLLLLSHFCTGMGQQWTFTIAPDYVAPFDLGMSCLGVILVCFHLVTITILDGFGLNVDYWLVVSHLTLSMCLSIVAAVAWIAYLVQDKIVKSQRATEAPGDSGISFSPSGFAKAFARCLPMVLATAIGLSTVFAVYPYIAPFELMEFKYQYPTQRLCLVADTVAAVIAWMLDTYAGVQTDWYSGRNVWWQLLWLLFIPYLGMAVCFLRCMHYPESVVSRLVLENPIIAGILTILYFFLGSFLFGFGPVPIDANAMGYGELVMAVGIPIRQISMNILKYMCEAHIQQFKLAKEGLKAGKAWPTDGMSKNSAIRYWIKIAATVGYSNFREMSTADVKQRLGAVARRIVRYRMANS